MPANLQGLWNEHIEAPWNADYHININLQMNYWPAEVANLAECHEPLFDFIERLAARGEADRAATLYGARGWMAHHTSDAWAFTVPIGLTVWGMWPHGGGVDGPAPVGAYLLHAATRRFSRERAWPLMRGAAAVLPRLPRRGPRDGPARVGTEQFARKHLHHRRRAARGHRRWATRWTSRSCGTASRT